MTSALRGERKGKRRRGGGESVRTVSKKRWKRGWRGGLTRERGVDKREGKGRVDKREGEERVDRSEGEGRVDRRE